MDTAQPERDTPPPPPDLAQLLTPEALPDIREPAAPGFLEANWPWLLPLAMGLLIVGVFVFRRLRNTPPQVPASTPRQQAERAISEAEATAATGDDAAFGYQLSTAVRAYLEARFKLNVPARTTEEFLDVAAGDARLSAAGLDGLEGFLRRCDLAKFARQPLTPEERAELAHTARQLVETAAASEAPGTQFPGGSDNSLSRQLIDLGRNQARA